MTLTTILLQTGTTGSNGWMSIIMMVALVAIFYFFMIRPQQKRQKEIAKFRQNLTTNDKVVTAGGIYGKIKEVKDTYVLIEVDNNVHIRVDKSMIMKDPTDLPQQK